MQVLVSSARRWQRTLHTFCLAMAVLLATALAGPSTALAANYGAIAYSPSTGAFGRSWDYPNRRGAERRALNGCRAHARDCRVAIWFRNACGALAVGNRGGWGSGWGNSRSRAQNEARAVCRRHTNNCKIRVWQCTSR